MSLRDSSAGASVIAARVRRIRRPAAVAGTLAFVLLCIAVVAPASAQVRPGKATDPIDQSRGLSTKPLPAAPAPEQPTERLAPEQRLRDPATGKQIVVPPRYERRGQPPPVTGYGTQGEGPVLLPPDTRR